MPEQIRMSMREQEYYTHTDAIGVSRDVARANLQAVISEYQQSVACFDVFKVAFARLTETPLTRPSEKVRDVARQALLAAGHAPHPEQVDSLAKSLSRRTDADDLAELQAPDSLGESDDGR